jgi:hypothetical protein
MYRPHVGYLRPATVRILLPTDYASRPIAAVTAAARVAEPLLALPRSTTRSRSARGLPHLGR